MAEDAFGIVGTVIAAAYHVESVVAEGGFGTVYRAHHGGFRAPVALKCLRLPPGLAPEARQHFLDSFRAEAELMFRLSASIPTVVRPLHVDAFTTRDGRFVPYLVLEWLEGSTLDGLIRKRREAGQAPFPLKRMVRMLTPVARALERAHNFRGPDGPVSIVHRDLKPENIFVVNVAEEETVKILDFGIGKAKSMVNQVAGRASQGGGGLSTFTPAYGAPEQWAPKKYGQTGPWTDVWGLALTLSEALVGHPIIDGDPSAIMGTVLDPQQRPTPGSEGVIVSDEVEDVFLKALALDPRDRYSDAGVFWNELLAAARITSGELQEVRLPRDARAEGGGALMELVERVEPPRRSAPPPARPPAAAARPPSGSLPMPTQAAAPRTLDLPPVTAPRTLDLPSLGADLEMDLAPRATSAAPVLRPLAPTSQPIPVAVSGAFEVPDLELAPVSRQPLPRTSSGMQRAIAPPTDDGDDDDFGPSASFDLDLSTNDPLVRRVSSGALVAVRVSEPPLPNSYRTPVPPARSSDPPPPDFSPSPPPVAMTVSLPPISVAAPLPSVSIAASLPPSSQPISLPPVTSLPPVSRAGAVVAVHASMRAPVVSNVRPPFQFKLAAAADATLVERLRPGGMVLGGALVVMIVDQIYSVTSGETFTIGPFRTSTLAGIVMVFGAALCGYRLWRERD